MTVLDYIKSVFRQHDESFVPKVSKLSESEKALRAARAMIRQTKAKAKTAAAVTPTARVKTPGIKSVYSKKSKVVPYKEGFKAVRLKTGEKGYVDLATGKFKEYVPLSVPDMIYSVDRSMFGDATPYSDAFYRASDEQQRQIIDRMNQIDWDTFWKYQLTYDPAKGGLTEDGQVLLDWVFEGIEVEEIEATPLGTSSMLYQR